MKKKKKFSRLTALLLAVMMLLPSHTSLLVLAEEESNGLCEHHPAHTVECGYVEGVSPCTYVCQECAKNVEDSDDKNKEEEADRKTDGEEKPQEDKPEALAASNIPGVAAEVLEKLAQEGIYPGAHPAAGDPWVVYLSLIHI